MERKLKIALGVGIAAFAALRLFGSSASSGPVSGFTGPTAALRQRIVEIGLAEEKAGVYEEGGTSNRSPRIDEYATTAGMGLGGAWCAAFVVWVLTKALGARPRWATPSTSANMVAARNAYRAGKLPAEYIAFAREPATLSRIRPGWVWIKGTTGNGSDPLEAGAGSWATGHIGIMVNPIGPEPGTYLSVDGNTRGGGSTPGGVYLTIRKWSEPELVIAFDPVALTAALQPLSA